MGSAGVANLVWSVEEIVGLIDAAEKTALLNAYTDEIVTVPVPPSLDHCKGLQECASEEGLVGLSTGRQVNARKRAVDRHVQAQDVDLRQMHVYFLRAMHARHDARIDNWQIELGCENAIDTALGSAGVYQRLYSIHPRRWRGRLCLDVRWVETDIDENGWSVGYEKVSTRCASRHSIETTLGAFTACHHRDGTGRTPAA